MSQVIVFAQSKGGAGKTTAAITLACELAHHGAAVTMIDADPNQDSAGWGSIEGKPEKITIIENPKGRSVEENILDDIDNARKNSPFVIVDLEGTASTAAAYAISRADLVLIACQGSQNDARHAAKTISLIKRQEQAFRREIPFRVLISRAPAALSPRLLRVIIEDFKAADVPLLDTWLIEREAFKAVQSYGGSLRDLTDSEVSGASKACENAAALTSEIVSVIKEIGQNEKERGRA